MGKHTKDIQASSKIFRNEKEIVPEKKDQENGMRI
jgi:hypothetical protein